MYDLIASYEVARMQNAERELRAERRALIAALKGSPAWRLAVADALRRLASRVDGFQAAAPIGRELYSLGDEGEA